MAGQGTIGLELLAARRRGHLDVVLVPVGGGGLIGGVASVLKAADPSIQVIGCQPAASDVMARSVAAGRIVPEVEVKNGGDDADGGESGWSTLSDATAGGVEYGSITLQPCMDCVDEWVTVSEAEIADALIGLLEEQSKLVEGTPGGSGIMWVTGAAACALAVFKRLAPRLAGKTVVLVCCGILKETVTSTVCLHRFCAACIDKCLAGRPPQHKDCPVCRANLHSRRSLRPDPNFDRLLRALYGDVVVYGQQEDSLVAAHNRAVAQAAREAQTAQLSRAQSEAAGAAAATAATAACPVKPVQQGTSQQSSERAAATPVAKRHHHRHHHYDDGHKQYDIPPDNRGAAAPTSRSPHGTRMRAGGTAVPVAMLKAPPSSPSPSSPPAHLTHHPRRGPRSAGAAAVQQVEPNAATAAAAMDVATRPAAPHGPLAVPAARSASELSFRHPGMVVVRLQPADPTGGGGGPPGTRAPLPALEKPFLLCPSKWTVGHIAQLLSQWIQQPGDVATAATARIPSAALRLVPAPGQLRGARRPLRSCTSLGALAAELPQIWEEGGGGGSRRGAASRGAGGGNPPLLVRFPRQASPPVCFLPSRSQPDPPSTCVLMIVTHWLRNLPGLRASQAAIACLNPTNQETGAKYQKQQIFPFIQQPVLITRNEPTTAVSHN
ncbi:hypothetical protein VOLCADRAFT_108389 [Volvox carteri f. nagariensis]|uniref:RING-type E3 ubiquitin transferase n=1 Tax=Volvox carteri f. nagariensis TaxID=3068 RepID=D8UJW5_VOLCA|nr:uncharacterized protein VOLCADRAFT_108389 [Volvox carteri f. nagariensis]EFJ39992.1 hypothetical protein VOLCADRAFT_108389 [Volvox carteri f. nagariensis]|eukprot:XP_002958957.1 hypothetical protein VOLCADRAFT_108389 [Volvox carteri f. nagariensis]